MDDQNIRGYKIYRSLDVDETAGGKQVKVGRCKLYGGFVFNGAVSAIRYLKIFDAGAAITVGATVPVLTFGIPSGATGSGFVLPIPPNGIEFTSGIYIDATTGIADNDTGAPGTNDVSLNLFYL